ncbi:MAG: MMPL family transporter, partial [Blastocatellia bacterium]
MTQFVVHRPRVTIAIVIAVTAVFAFGLRRGLELDVSPLSFVARNSQERRDFAEARKNFGADDYLLIAVICPPQEDIFFAANLDRLRTLHRKIERTSGVVEVLSLGNVPYARSLFDAAGKADGASLEKLIPESLHDSQRLAEARAAATNDRLYVGNLVSADAKTAALNVLLNSELPTSKRHEITRQIYDLTNQAGFQATYFTGDPFSQWQATEALKKDLKIFLPLTIFLIALLLWLCFRSTVAIVLPLMTIGIGLIWLLGLMAFFRAHFTILALMLPTLMLAIGCSYMIHVLNQIGIACGERELGTEKLTAIEGAMRIINLPVIVSALTIIAGFLSLAFTEVPSIRTTAIYAAIGAAFTMMLSLTFIPAVLAVLPARSNAFRSGHSGGGGRSGTANQPGGMVRLLERTGHWATSHQRLLYVLTVIVVVVSLIGVFRIKIEIDYFKFFKPHSETQVGLSEISQR